MDHDDSMLSTPSSNPDMDESIITNPPHDNNGDDEEMFPADAQPGLQGRPQTPQNDHLNAAAPGELSPPRSQTAQDPMQQDDEDLSPPNPNMIAGASGSASASTAANVPASTDDAEWKAGAGWKNKKAQMEMYKAMEGFSDKDFSLKPYGDVLAHRIGPGAGE